jgi:hypothetical protein
LGLGKRKEDPECGSLLGSAFNLDFSAMNLDDMFGDGQPQPRSAEWPGPRLVCDIKSFKNTGKLLLRDADSRVSDFNDKSLGFRFQ